MLHKNGCVITSFYPVSAVWWLSELPESKISWAADNLFLKVSYNEKFKWTQCFCCFTWDISVFVFFSELWNTFWSELTYIYAPNRVWTFEKHLKNTLWMIVTQSHTHTTLIKICWVFCSEWKNKDTVTASHYVMFVSFWTRVWPPVFVRTFA